MAKRLKRAFTIVELVIVIAVIAILAAVLIPTFTTLIDKANESNDIALVKNLNTALVSKEATDEVNTMQDALDAAYEYGYTVDKLTPSSSGDIVWDEVNNRFALINDGEVVFGEGTVSKGASLWRIAKDKEYFSDTYSNYLAGEWTTVPVASTGVDVGTNEGLDVTYTNTDAKQTVTIRTNGGTLTVNGPYDTVNHYDMAVKVVVKAVAKNSYHEYGEVLGNIELASGRVVVENNATVSTILVTAQSADSIKVEVNSNATVGTVAATKKDVITSENTTVPSTTDKVTGAVTVNKDFAGGLGTEKSPYLVATAEQFTNINNLYETASATYWFKQIDDIELQYVTAGDVVLDSFNGVYDGANYNISVVKEGEASGVMAVFGVVDSTTVKDVNLYSAENCLLSASAVTGSNAKKLILQDVDAYSKDNVTIKIAASNSGFLVLSHVYSDCDLDIQFIDCDIKADLTNSATCTGVFIGGSIYWALNASNLEAARNHTLSIKNCTYSGNITGNDQAGFIFGNQAGTTYNISKNGWSVQECFEHVKSHLTLDNVKNNGTIAAKKVGVFSAGGEILDLLDKEYIPQVSGSYVVSENILTDANVEVYYNGSAFEFSGYENAGYTYKVALTFSLQTSANTAANGRDILFDATYNGQSGTGKLSGGIVCFESQLSNYGLTEDEYVGEYDFASVANVKVYIDGETKTVYAVLADPAEGGYPRPTESNTITLKLYAYDANGKVVGSVVVR